MKGYCRVDDSIKCDFSPMERENAKFGMFMNQPKCVEQINQDDPLEK